MPGKLEAIWRKRTKRGPADPRAAGPEGGGRGARGRRRRAAPWPPARPPRRAAGRGSEGDANRGGRRQVTMIEEERWAEAVSEVGGEAGADLPPGPRRATLTISGPRLR